MMWPVTLDNPSRLWLLIAVIPLLWLCVRCATDLSRRGRWILAITRATAAALLALALCGPTITRARSLATPYTVIIAKDVSGSLQASGASRDARIRELLAGLPKNVAVEQVDLAATAVPSNAPTDTSQTNLQAALDNILAFSSDRPASDVVLISDGRETVGSASRAAQRIAARGGRVNVLGVGDASVVPPKIVRLEPSAQNRLGLPIRITAVVDAALPSDVDAVLCDATGREVDRRNIHVTGRRATVLEHTLTDAGFVGYQVRLVRDGRILDTLPAVVAVEGPPKVLVVDPFIDEVATLVSAISSLKVSVDVRAPDALPANIEGYAAIILSDLSGSELSEQQRDAIQRSVEMGNGLLFIAGGNCVANRWAANPVAKLLPLTFAPPREKSKQKRSITVCYVLDRSGSMQAPLDGNISKLDLVKAAVQVSLRDLPDEAKVAVVVFDGEPDTIVPATPVTQRQVIDDALDRIAVGGGTDMGKAISRGLDVLAAETGERYLVVLTDGITNPPPFGWDSHIQQAQALAVNWTSIAVGQEADQALMSGLASRAGGQSFFCGAGARIPKVFIAQARQVRRSSQDKRPAFTPQPGPAFGQLRGIPAADLPELVDAMDTQARIGADTILSGRDGMPLLATWRVGLGNVIAFSSADKADWAPLWLNWNRNTVFWSQLLQRCLRPPDDIYAKATVYDHGDHVTLELDVTDQKALPVTGLKCDIASSLAGSTTRPSDLAPVHERRPGLYEIDLTPLPQPTVTTLRMYGEKKGQLQYSITLRKRSSSEEITGMDTPALQSIAAAGNGLFAIDAQAIVAACKPPAPSIQRDRTSLIPVLMALAILAWLADVCVRKFSGIG